MLSLWENGYLTYAAWALCLFGAAAKWLASQRYKRLIRQGDALGNAKDKQLKQMKGRYENHCRVNGAVPNTGIFVEKCLLEYRYLGTSLGNVDGLARKMGILLLFAGGMSAWAGYRGGLAAEAAMQQLAIWGGLAAVLLLWDLFLDTAARRRDLVTVLCHYFENAMGNRRGYGGPREETAAEPESSGEALTESEKDEMEYLKQSLDRIAASREETAEEGMRCRLTSDEERVIKEIIKEYLA